MKHLKIHPKHFGYIFVLPFFVVMAVFQVYPLLDTLKTSFTDENFSQLDAVPQFIGLDNYLRELGSELLQQSLLNTLVVTAASIVFQMTAALLIAALLTSPDLKIRGKNVWQVLFFLPSQISVAILALYILYFFSLQGVINTLFHGGNTAAYTDFFASDLSAWSFITGTTVFLSFGITAYFLVNSIRAIPKALFEAAMIDGASGRQVFWRISLPNLQPILIFLIVISLILDLCMFDLPYALYSAGGGGLTAAVGSGGGNGNTGVTLGSYVYQRSFIWDSDIGAGASVVMLMFVLIASLSLVYFRIMKKTQAEFSVVG